MQKKLIVGILAATTLSWLVAGAVFAAPSPNPHSHRLPQTIGTPSPISGSVIGLAPLMTATVTTTETLTPTVVPTATVVSTSTLSPGNEKIAKAISDYFGVGLDAVSTIHHEEQGWGQVFFVFMLAQTTGQSPEDILAMRQDGQGWGEIIMGLGVKPGNHGNNLGAAVSGKSNPNSTPTAVPSVLAPTNRNDTSGINTDCKGNPNNKGNGNPCPQPGSTPLAPTNSNSNNNGRGNENSSKGNGNGNSNNNGNGNSKGKGGK